MKYPKERPPLVKPDVIFCKLIDTMTFEQALQDIAKDDPYLEKEMRYYVVTLTMQGLIIHKREKNMVHTNRGIFVAHYEKDLEEVPNGGQEKV